MENRIIISPELAFSINFGIVKMTFLQIRRVIHRHSRKEIGSSMRRIIPPQIHVATQKTCRSPEWI